MSYDDHSKQYTPVIIEAECFKKLWRKSRSHQEVALGDETTWVNDYKYKSAERGFSFGEDNPVPFASINYDPYIIEEPIFKKKLFFGKKIIDSVTKHIHSISFNDGITRTIWLLCNGADKVPFSMKEQEAYSLSRFFPDDVEILKIEKCL